MQNTEFSNIIAVMLNWNGYQYTVECINSLKKSTMPFTKICVLDQASPDGSGRKLKKFYESDNLIHIILNNKNYGFATGTNIGIKKALHMGAAMVFIVNNDTIVDENCVQHLYDALLCDPLAGAAGPAIMYYSNPGKIWQAGGFFNKLKMGTSVPAKGKMFSEINKTIEEVGYLTGCALLIPVKTFNEVGFFDQSYFLYSDDVDYSLRIKRAGMNMYFVPEAKVWHKIEDIAVDRSTPLVLYHLARSSIIMLRKNFSGFEKLYGIFLRFTIYTLFRCWQIIKGQRGWDSYLAWFKGLIHGLSVKVDK